MKNKNTYIIGEIGQNHNGSVEIARKIIDASAKEVKEDLFGMTLQPMNAVKLTKRDLEQELSSSMMNMPYDGPNSFGKTYGEHRAFLELDDHQHYDLFQYAKEKGLEFVETLCAVGCLSILKNFKPDHLKVASRDLTNLPLLEALAETEIPMIVSTGMASKKELDNAINVISKHNDQLSVLHCVSEYPTQPKNVNLNTIPYLRENYPDHRIGFSDHTIGISVPIAAVSMGAEIIEKHITLDRSMKGTDQKGSLGPDGIRRMVRDIRLLEMSMGEFGIYACEDTHEAKKKLGRSVASKRDIKKGEQIKAEDVWMLSPGDGIEWVDREKIIGRIAGQDIRGNEVIYPNMIEER